MSGGKPRHTRRRCARRLATGLLGGLISTAAVPETLLADEPSHVVVAAATMSDCPTRPDEKSIIVDGSGDPDMATASDAGGESLEPIANVSEYEPELAEGAAKGSTDSPVPTLADASDDDVEPGNSPMTLATPEEPTADDVCIEDEVGPTTAAPAHMQPASFSGVTPGVTTRNQVLEQWGEPFEGDAQSETLVYKLEKFPTVAMMFLGERVESIRVELLEPTPPAGLVAKLGLSEFRPVETKDTDGHVVCVTFPERGVTLSFGEGDAATASDDGGDEATTPSGIAQIEVRPIEAAPFIARASACRPTDYSRRIADLETALTLGAKGARERLLLSQAKLAVNQAVVAEKLAAQAAQMEPTDDAYQLHWAKCLMHRAQYDRAVQLTRGVLEGSTATPLVRAEAMEQMAALAALGSKEVQQRAIPLHNKAIELADGLTKSSDAAARAAANQVLLSAHLAIAERIAQGDWQQKDEFVQQWISRASALAEEMIANNDADVSLRLQIAVSALTAGGRLQPPIDPKPLVAEAEQAAREATAKNKDAYVRDNVNWQLGMAYYFAAEMQHRRGEADLAVKYGETADATLTPLAEKRSGLPDTDYVLGRLYFQIGAVHAVHFRDHNAACQWYDRAVGLLRKPVPLTPLTSPGQHGDALVSMGVSYWEIGQREKAYELTRAGVDLVSQGINEGLLAATAIDVPQGNLNAMAKALGRVNASMPRSPAASRTQLAQRQRGSAKRSGPAQAQPSRMADRRTTSGEAVRRR